jgi:threonine dehydrogenase-like Zn-dependent dehydrogenase
MRAVRCREGAIEVVEVPAPRADQGVRVRIRSAGICGSDLHLLAGQFGPIRHTLGHELAGVAAGGRPVAIEPLLPCGECAGCRSGDYNLCVRGPGMLIGVGLDGGMCDEIVVPERCLVPLPGAVAPGDACLIEPLAVAIHGLRLARLRSDQRVAVVGGGTLGLCALAAATSAGAEVALVARHDAQRAAGERLGARAPSGSYDLVVDAAGTRDALARAVELCRPGATLLLVATYWGGLLELPGFAVCLKEVRVQPASLYAREGAARDVDVAAAILATRPEIARALITHRFPLDAAAEAFRTAADRASGAIKVVLEPGSD